MAKEREIDEKVLSQQKAEKTLQKTKLQRKHQE